MTARKCTRNGNIVRSLVHPTFDIMLLAFVSFGCYESNRENKKKYCFAAKISIFLLHSVFLHFGIAGNHFGPTALRAPLQSAVPCSNACIAINCALKLMSVCKRPELSFILSGCVTLCCRSNGLFKPFHLHHFDHRICHYCISQFSISSFVVAVTVLCVAPHKRKTKYMSNCPAFSFPQSFKYANTKIQNYILCGCRCCLLNPYIDDIALCASSF